jgi:hypothetical protein
MALAILHSRGYTILLCLPLYCGRSAVDFEKKAHADNLELSKAMEKNMIAVASEVEKLRADLANAEKRVPAIAPAAAVANPGIIMNLL